MKAKKNNSELPTVPMKPDMKKIHYSLSGIRLDPSPHDRLWLDWIELYGVGSASINRFLDLHPPDSNKL